MSSQQAPVAIENPYQMMEEPQMEPPLPDNIVQANMNDEIMKEPAKFLIPNAEALPDTYRMSSYAEQVNKLRKQESSMHCQSIFATLFLIGGIAAGIVVFLNGDVSVGEMVGILAGTYIFYLIVGCCCNKLSSYLGNIDKGENFQKYYEWLRRSDGHFWFHACCYHYETRYHTRTYTDSNGNTQTETYTTVEKVVTHTATENLIPSKTQDQSGSIDRIRAETTVVFIHFFLNYRFRDEASRGRFEGIYANFKRRNTFDTHQDFTMGYKLEGMVERKAFFVGELDCDLNSWFYVCGMVGCLCPYSYWVQSKISRFAVDTMKVLTI